MCLFWLVGWWLDSSPGARGCCSEVTQNDVIAFLVATGGLPAGDSPSKRIEVQHARPPFVLSQTQNLFGVHALGYSPHID
eukprot:5184922-Amphidinium_carterae.1